MKNAFFLGLLITVAFNGVATASTKTTKPAAAKTAVEITDNKELIELLNKAQRLNTNEELELISSGINNETRREVQLNEELELNSVRQ